MAKRKKKELSMRKVREILRLGLKCGMGYRRIGRSCSTSHSTVSEYLGRVKTKGLTYDEIETMDDLQLERLLKNDLPERCNQSREQPDWKMIHQELKRKGVTLQLLWVSDQLTPSTQGQQNMP
jgi:hypothetical protein